MKDMAMEAEADEAQLRQKALEALLSVDEPWRQCVARVVAGLPAEKVVPELLRRSREDEEVRRMLEERVLAVDAQATDCERTLPAQAVQLYEIAAGLDCTHAMLRLADMYLQKGSPVWDARRGRFWTLRAAIVYKEPFAMLQAALDFAHHGDMDRARELCRAADAAGHPLAPGYMRTIDHIEAGNMPSESNNSGQQQAPAGVSYTRLIAIILVIALIYLLKRYL